MTIVWIIVAVVITYLVVKNSNRPPQVIPQHHEEERKTEITEEMVFKAQADFEEVLAQDYLPDALHREDIYLYRELMLPWYKTLSGKYRYDDAMTQKLRDDWTDYLYYTQNSSTLRFLSFETEEEAKSEDYRERSILEYRKARAIEDGFAASIGEEAVMELKRIRELDMFCFSRKGELAPEGFQYDAHDELKPIKE